MTGHLSSGREQRSLEGTVKEHPLIVVVVVLVCDLLLSVCVSFPQFLVHHLLNLQKQFGHFSNTNNNKLDFGIKGVLRSKTIIMNTFRWDYGRLTFRMLYLLKTPPAFPPSLCSLIVLCSWNPSVIWYYFKYLLLIVFKRTILQKVKMHKKANIDNNEFVNINI